MDDHEQMIQAFLEEMQRRYAREVDGITLPEGTLAYVERRVAEGDVDTLMFMLKLGWLMGLQTGFAAGRAGDAMPSSGPGPIQA
jgi:hypothetical protein